MSELLSICIPTYNRNLYLKDLLDVLYHEINTDKLDTSLVKIYISDNASTDGTEQLVVDYQKKLPIEYFKNSTNLGAVKNIANLFKYAKGDYVWIFGDDDLLEIGSLKKIIDIISQNKPGLFIAFNKEYESSLSLPVKYADFQEFVQKVACINPYLLIAHSLLTCNIFLRSCINFEYLQNELVDKNNVYLHMYTMAYGLLNVSSPVIITDLNPLIVREHGRAKKGLRARAVDTEPKIKSFEDLWRAYLLFVSNRFVSKELEVWTKSRYPLPQDVTTVIHYYNPEKRDDLYFQTLYCLSCYLSAGSCVILSDGSGDADVRFELLKENPKFKYLYSKTKLSFSEVYNQGIDYAKKTDSNDYICLSDDSIFVNPDAIIKMLTTLISNSTVGCVIPYLSTSVQLEQNDNYLKRKRFPSSMTLNVNLFRKNDLEDIGRVPEYLSGNFNDSVMFMKLRRKNKKIMLIDAGKIFHIGRPTDDVSFEKDKDVFNQKHPEFASINPNLDFRHSVFSQNVTDYIYGSILDLCWFKVITKFLLKLRIYTIELEKCIFSIFTELYQLVENNTPLLKAPAKRLKLFIKRKIF